VIQRCVPFRLRELHAGNDSALVNHLLLEWCREQRIQLSRSRPYRKNDNAWVEQKNWTHVRKVVGYRRFDHTSELHLLNEIYGVLRLYKNFFLPTIKLVSKSRVAGRIKREYDRPRTPYQRMMECGHVDRNTQCQLQALYDTLNPAELGRRLSELRERLEAVSAAKAEVVSKRAWRGPEISIGKRRAAAAALRKTATA
jgi:hypothetical protein